ncbi:MAG: ribonuclease H-like domain-containing protein [Oliverpabstia sp.]
MITQTYHITIPSEILEAENIPAEDCLFFDIETTGLSWRQSHLYLLGIVLYENDQWTLKQWFCQRPSEEKEVIMIFSELLNAHKYLIHFNGSTFDVPYLMHKYTFYQLEQSWEHLEQIDLYRRLLPYKNCMGLTRMRQKDLEVYLGIYRKDTFTGGELINCYQEYLKSGDETLLAMLLLHNKEDVDGITALLSLLTIPQIFAGKFDTELTQIDLITTAGKEKPDILQISLPFSLPCILHSECEYYQLSVVSGHMVLSVPFVSGTRKYFFSNYKDYYYLPLEDQAIHKSVGAYVDKEHRERAKSFNCYQKKEGLFLPQFAPIFTPAFQREYKDPVLWFEADESLIQDKEKMAAYMVHLIGTILKPGK